MEEILSKKHYRRSFYLLVFLALTICIIFRFIVLPNYDKQFNIDWLNMSASLLDSFVISMIITVFIGSFVFWLKPEILKKSQLDIIHPIEISPLLKKAAVDSRTWVFKGSCGRYTRATTLPMMTEAAKNEGIGRDVKITLIDPKNQLLCEEYANYRKSLKSSDGKSGWTVEKVQEEIIATIITALKYRYREPLMSIQIHLMDHFSAFRLDISDKYVVITKEDKDASGLRADSNTYFYDSYKDDVRLTERQSREVNYSNPFPNGKDLNEQEIRELIIGAEIVDENIIEHLKIDNILSGVNNPTDPYSSKIKFPWQ